MSQWQTTADISVHRFVEVVVAILKCDCLALVLISTQALGFASFAKYIRTLSMKIFAEKVLDYRSQECFDMLELGLMRRFGYAPDQSRKFIMSKMSHGIIRENSPNKVPPVECTGNTITK